MSFQYPFRKADGKQFESADEIYKALEKKHRATISWAVISSGMVVFTLAMPVPSMHLERTDPLHG